jgi:hypothetical protein
MVPVEVGPENRPMSSRFAETEFEVLRKTIASRGTTRMVLLPVTLLGWAALTLVLLLFAELPVASLLTLAVLVAGFEAIHALHVGVERIGRYLQVCYEGQPDGPRWETTAMAVGPALPGGGIDPLFSVVFICAAVIDLIPPALPGPTPVEMAAVLVPHAVFIFRVLRARGAAARQRAVELESFRALLRQRDREQ